MAIPGGPAFQAIVLEIMLKSLFVMAVVLLLTWFMRRSSAAERHLYLSAAVIALLLLPPASLILPSWNIGLLPDPFFSAGKAPREAAGPVEPADPASTAGGDHSSQTEIGAGRTVYPHGGPGSGRDSHRWILVTWMFGAGILLVRLLGGKIYGYWIACRAPAAGDERILDAVKSVSEQMGFTGELRVVESDHLMVPFVSGLFRPRLIMPFRAKSWSSERIEAILHHELAHIKRKDILVQFFAQIACCLYWINPLTRNTTLSIPVTLSSRGFPWAGTVYTEHTMKRRRNSKHWPYFPVFLITARMQKNIPMISIRTFWTNKN